MASIRQHEAHLARSGTIIRKFFLNVSKEEQRQRFLDRLDEPDKNWKFSPGDVVERGYWDDYQAAYDEALRETSRPWAPWYAIPADDKDFMRVAVAEVVYATLKSLPLRHPPIAEENRAHFGEMREQLLAEGPMPSGSRRGSD
jgi:polyphosphate kinase 2 (PPK2 family)